MYTCFFKEKHFYHSIKYTQSVWRRIRAQDPFECVDVYREHTGNQKAALPGNFVFSFAKDGEALTTVKYYTDRSNFTYVKKGSEEVYIPKEFSQLIVYTTYQEIISIYNPLQKCQFTNTLTRQKTQKM